MKDFNIRELEHLSGIKAHTLRIWEHRYAFIKPGRNRFNFRYYSIHDVSHLLNVALLTKNGYRISLLSAMDTDEIETLMGQQKSDDDLCLKAIHVMIAAMYTLNTKRLETTIDDCFRRWHPEMVMTKIIIEFLKKTGLLWEGSRQAEEHLVVTIIRKKMMAAIENLDYPIRKNKTFLLFLPGGKSFDMVLLYIQFLLKSNSCEVLYMGTDVTAGNIKTVVKFKQPDILLTYASRKNQVFQNEIGNWLKQEAPHIRLMLVAYQQQPIHPTCEKVIVLNYDDTIEFLVSELQQPA